MKAVLSYFPLPDFYQKETILVSSFRRIMVFGAVKEDISPHHIYRYKGSALCDIGVDQSGLSNREKSRPGFNVFVEKIQQILAQLS